MPLPPYPIAVRHISSVPGPIRATPIARPLPPHLAFLRDRDHPTPPPPAKILPFGDPCLDGCLPHGGLPLGALHELAAIGIGAETCVLPAAFVALLAARLPSHRPILWVASRDDLYPPGLLHLGPQSLDPARLLLVQADNDAAILGAMETALRAGGLAAVVGEVGAWGRAGARIATRRLQLACQVHGITAFALRRWPYGGNPARDRETSAASTRWRLAPAPGRYDATGPTLGLGPSRWVVELQHARGGRPGAWIMEVSNDAPTASTSAASTPALRVVATLADHAATPAPHPRQAAGHG